MIIANQSKNKLNNLFLIIFILINYFQIVRNINNNIYIFMYLFFFSMTLLTLKYRNTYIDLTSFLFLITLLNVSLVSFFYSPINENMISINRYVPIVFILIILLFKKIDLNLFDDLLTITYIAILMGGLSIIYQFIFGPIPFVALSSFREGFNRYASILGSLTLFGTVGPLGIFVGYVLYYKKKISTHLFLISLFIILIGSLLSLQKASIYNSIIIFVFILIHKFSLKKFVILLIVSIILILFLTVFYNEIFYSLIYYAFSNNLSLGLQDFINRQTYLPSIVINYHDLKIYDYITGIGFKALAGIMGLENYPMAHNNFYDILLSGGIFHLVFFIMMIFKSYIYLIKSGIGNNVTNYFIYFLVSYALINMTFGAFTFYHPLTGILLLVVLFQGKNLITKKELK